MRPFEQVEVLRAACCVAAADGKTTEEESRLLTKLADESGVGDASLNAMLERAANDKSFCKEQFRILKTDPQESIAILLQVALADGVVDPAEKETLKVFADRLGVPSDVFTELVSRTVSMFGKKTS